MKILVAEDDPDIATLITHYLRKAGWEPHVAVTGNEALSYARQQPVELAILDVMLPGTSGLDICRALRADKLTAHLPIIIVTARAEETDRIVGLEIGADDYVLKPFNPRELVARIKAILRRSGAGSQVRAPEAAIYTFGQWVLKAGERTLVDREGVTVPLSTGEFNLLLAFVTHPHQVLSRDQLLDLTQGREAAGFDRSIDNQVSRLRRKIETDAKEPEFIRTVWGGGYTLAADVSRP
jgi:two-component system OmpR family response regulator